MNADDIDKLEAGPETDALVARKAMKWPSTVNSDGGPGAWNTLTGYRPRHSFRPSTSISAAMELLHEWEYWDITHNGKMPEAKRY